MRNFATSLILPYAGNYGALAIGAQTKSMQKPQCISLTVDWRTYGLQFNIAGGVTTFNGAVSIDLARGAVANPLDVIKSVFIDNTGVDRPVYLRSEDTGQVITCPDAYYGWYPVITNGEQFTLFTDNIVPLRDGKQQTRLIFSNAPFDTFGQPELNRAAALYRSSGSSQFTTPVLGDKISSALKDTITAPTGAAVNSLDVIIPARPNAVAIITGIIVSGTQGSGSSSSYGTGWISFGADPALAANQIANFNWAGSNTWGNIGTFLNLQNLQISIPLTYAVNFSVRNALQSGSSPQLTCSLTYALIDLPALS